jgi:Tfp pilus assembly protein PilZ
MGTQKDEKSGRERRKAKRFYASFVEYCHINIDSSQKVQAFAENISSTGICILANEEIQAKETLLVSIYLLDGTKPIEAKGRVAWMRPSIFLNDIPDKKHFDVGIEFVDVSQEDQNKLVSYTQAYPNEVTP